MAAGVPPDTGLLTFSLAEMKMLARKTSLRLILDWAQRALFAGATVMLGYSTFVLADIWIFSIRRDSVSN